MRDAAREGGDERMRDGWRGWGVREGWREGRRREKRRREKDGGMRCEGEREGEDAREWREGRWRGRDRERR